MEQREQSAGSQALEKQLADPRRGLPSSSAIARLKECPGSHALSQSLRGAGKAYEKRFDPDRDSGNRIHAYLASSATLSKEEKAGLVELVGLSDEELRTAQICDRLREQTVVGWIGTDPQGKADFEVILERRFWYPDKWLPDFSGKPDYVLIDRGRAAALILEYKSGRKETQSSADSLQLRSEVVLIKRAFPFLREIAAGIIQPWVSRQVELARYDSGGTLEKARLEIESIIDRVSWEKDHRVAGTWCEFCRARPYCQEARDYVSGLYRLGLATLSERVAELPTGARGSDVIDNIATVREILDAIEDRYRQILAENPDALDRHYLHEGRRNRSVLDAGAMRAALAQVLSDRDFDSCATFWVSKLEELFKKKGGKNFDELAAKLIEESRGEPYITKISKRERDRRKAIQQAQEALGNT